MAHCNILWCGKYTQQTENELHNHDYYQMITVISGTGNLLIGDDIYTLEKGANYIIYPNKYHSIKTDENEGAVDDLKLFDIKFTIENGALLNDIILYGPYFKIANFNYLSRCFDTIIDESTYKKPHYYFVICALLLEMLIYIVREQKVIENEKPITQNLFELSTTKETAIENIIRYIDENYMNEINIQILSKKAGINRTTLINLFKKVFDTTPIRYINTIRLNKAKELLEHTNANIGSIAELTGFQSIHYFSNFFKANVGTTPAQYRINIKKSKYFTFSD